jgi:adenylosuccinate synthase
MDINVRYNGGANAGHTIVNGEQSFKFHLIPSGIIYPHVIPVIGAGVVVDLAILIEEMEGLKNRGIDTDRLLISGNAHLTMPYHKVLDQLAEKRLGKMAIGTTRRGIGPTYADKAYRSGIRVQDLLDMKIFYEKLVAALKDKNRIIKAYGKEPLDPEKIMNDYIVYAEKIAHHVVDAARYINNALDAGSNVLLEGAQGTFLDIDYGTYPFVTSSSAISGGATTGAGVPPKKINFVLGVSKAYTTRVGSGPFPTELNDEIGEYLAKTGAEFGTTTGRKRRCGWLDIVMLKYASMLNGFDSLAITKLDVLSGLEKIKVCVAYEYEGRIYEEYPYHQTIFHKAKPIYEELPGWMQDISDATSFAQLPANARNFIQKIEEWTRVPVGIISVGPRRRQTIFKEFYIW